MNALFRLDRQLFILLNERWHTPALDWLMPRLTNLNKTFGFWFLILLLALWLWERGGRNGKVFVALLVLVIPLSDQISSKGVKYVFMRVRPCAPVLVQGHLEPSVPGVRLLPPGSEPLTSPSFPSSHATTMAALATLTIWRFRRQTRWAWLVLLLPLSVGYSRIYIGVHYPLDVLGGWALGFTVAALSCLLVARWERRFAPSLPGP
jgi:undecaprenyl-diphosphatase